MDYKNEFHGQFKNFLTRLKKHIITDDDQWSIKGFIDAFKNIYAISSDTKIVSKILEIHLFPKIMEFARMYNYKVVLAEHQNYYPDLIQMVEQKKYVLYKTLLSTEMVM